MKAARSILLLVFSAYLANSIGAQSLPQEILHQQWKAYWIEVPGEEPAGYGVYLFRKQISLAAVPATFIIHVSADNRYKLFVNGELVSLGPARGDINHWNFETVDIARFLKAGINCIAARVWNEAGWRPEGQISLRTGFILQGDGPAEQLINTNDEWKCMRDDSYHPIRINLPTYYVAGPGELVNMEQQARGWETAAFNDSAWKKPLKLFHGTPKNVQGGYGTINEWMLVPSSIPQPELKVQRLPALRKAEGITPATSFPAQASALTIPANSIVTLLLDQTFLTNAYPTVIFSGGKGAGILLTYQEGLFTIYPAKGNRNETEGKTIMGRKDSLISDGSAHQTFTTLAYRTYRYIQLKIITQTEPLVLDDIYGTFSGYPFQFNARLESTDSSLATILEIGWRTARLCAQETYMDCPYYEQLQYIGDARIQGLVSLYNSGDDRLLRNAINTMDHSRQPEGVTLSRHPSYTPQYIPTFSLWYIGMLHDYWMYGHDTLFIKNKLAGARQILDFFHGFQQADGSLKSVPYWMFSDWVETKGWTDGAGPFGKDGTSAMLDLQLLWAYQLAAEIETRTGIKDYAKLYLQYAAQLKRTILAKYWIASRQCFADRPEADVYSQHTNALAILTGVVNGQAAVMLSKKLLADTSLSACTIYFKYYLHQALVKAGNGNEYLNWLGIWRENIRMGLTTWAETDPNTTRSDCHAWGASPNIEFFRTVLGIDSDAPGFSKVRIEPHLGKLTNIGGAIPHPNGTIAVHYLNQDGKWIITITLPSNTGGRFIWKGRSYTLKEGKNSLNI